MIIIFRRSQLTRPFFEITVAYPASCQISSFRSYLQRHLAVISTIEKILYASYVNLKHLIKNFLQLMRHNSFVWKWLGHIWRASVANFTPQIASKLTIRNDLRRHNSTGLENITKIKSRENGLKRNTTQVYCNYTQLDGNNSYFLALGSSSRRNM